MFTVLDFGSSYLAMRFCVCHSTGRLVAADDPDADCIDKQLKCQECGMQVLYVRGSSRHIAYFRHKSDAGKCSLRSGSVEKPAQADKDEFDSSSHRNMWHETWQRLGQDEHREARGIGKDKSRPRDLGDTRMNAILEFQHSRMTSSEFNARNAGCAKAIWIFDATGLPLYHYSLSDNCFFVQDLWRHEFAQSDSVRVLFHCRDGQLYRAACDNVIYLTTEHPQSPQASEHPLHLYVRLLRRCEAADHHEIRHFCGLDWPPAGWPGQPLYYPQKADKMSMPIRVLGTYGRQEIDKIHRQRFRVFPTDSEITVYLAPPGAGKTSEIVEAIKAWANKRVLVVTFNKSTQLTMNKKLEESALHSRCQAMTLDALCLQACGKPKNYTHKFDDEVFLRLVCYKRCQSRREYLSKYKSGGGRGSAGLVKFLLRHPHGKLKPCKFHEKLCGTQWGCVKKWPIKKVVEEKCCPAALRYKCDNDQLLGPLIDSKWEVVVVDEMQDLLSAQELRLLKQSRNPLVLVGDMMQAINGFKDALPCNTCEMQRESTHTLPPAIEWYGTYRLDSRTAGFLEERFGRTMISLRRGSAQNKDASICWQDQPQFPHTLILCRCNVSVMRQFLKMPMSRVVNGAVLSKRLSCFIDQMSEVSDCPLEFDSGVPF
jgi:hypothetical protein